MKKASISTKLISVLIILTFICTGNVYPPSRERSRLFPTRIDTLRKPIGDDTLKRAAVAGQNLATRPSESELAMQEIRDSFKYKPLILTANPFGNPDVTYMLGERIDLSLLPKLDTKTNKLNVIILIQVSGHIAMDYSNLRIAAVSQRTGQKVAVQQVDSRGEAKFGDLNNEDYRFVLEEGQGQNLATGNAAIAVPSASVVTGL